ncbi:MAG: TIGR04149 family rSAM-modified RiPP [Tannerella sp.]|jgi:natural product precursor|nr:TIGR04149 family rSAM-modified RiPP [Tannerella sp.]
MKTINDLKLTTLSRNVLEKRRMNLLKGGGGPGRPTGPTGPTDGDCLGTSCNCGTTDPAKKTTTDTWYKA